MNSIDYKPSSLAKVRPVIKDENFDMCVVNRGFIKSLSKSFLDFVVHDLATVKLFAGQCSCEHVQLFQF